MLRWNCVVVYEVRAREQLLSLEGIPKRAIKLWHAERIMSELEKRVKGAKSSISFKIKQADLPPITVPIFKL